MEKNDNFKNELESQYAILIKASENSERKRFVVITTILSITLVSSLVSVVFAILAFKSSHKINVETQEATTHYQTLSVQYNNTNNLNLEGIGNGYTLKTPKLITITNEGDTDITFDIKLTSINTSLLSTNNLVYTISKNNDESSVKQLPLSEKVITSDVKISPSQTISYIIKVSFNGTIEENNYSNYYNSKIVIEQKDNKSDLLDR